MGNEVAFLVLLGFLVLCGCCIFIVSHIANKLVSEKSKLVYELKKLNAKTGFYVMEDRFYLYKRYDNKSNFLKTEPQYLMMHKIREEIDFYSLKCKQIRENRRLFSEYKRQVAKILSTFSNDIEEVKIPLFIFKYFENKQFKRLILSPVLDYFFEVDMQYISPKGRVNISKSGKYNLEDISVCLESVSRSCLEKDVYEKLATVERGIVSDSMRYDIMKRDGFKCVICGASATQGARLHIDHIVPIAKGGKSTYENLRTLCERCNIGKSDKIEDVNVEPIKTVKSEFEILCPKCNSKMILRNGKYGRFYGCKNYPDCDGVVKIK